MEGRRAAGAAGAAGEEAAGGGFWLLLCCVIFTVFPVLGSSESHLLWISSPGQTKLHPSAEAGRKNLPGKKSCVSHAPGVGGTQETKGFKFPLLGGIDLQRCFLVQGHGDCLSSEFIYQDKREYLKSMLSWKLQDM